MIGASVTFLLSLLATQYKKKSKMIISLHDGSHRKEYNNLRNDLETLILRYEYPPKYELEHFPQMLQALTIISDVDLRIPKFPDSMQVLSIYGEYNQKIQVLPHGLKILKVNGGYNKKLPALPQGLKSLSFYGRYDKKLPALPQGLKSLYLDSHYNKKLPALPYGLQTLSLTHLRVHELVGLPSSIEILIIKLSPIQQLNKCVALPKLRELRVFSDQISSIPLLFNTRIFSNDIASFEITENHYSKCNVRKWKQFFGVMIAELPYTYYWQHTIL